MIGAKITAFVRKTLRIPKKQKKHPEREPLLGQTKIINDEESAPAVVEEPEEESAPRLADVLTYQTTLNLAVYSLLALYTLAYDQVIYVNPVRIIDTDNRADDSSLHASPSNVD